MQIHEMASAFLAVGFLLAVPGSGCGGEISGTLAKHDCWIATAGSADFDLKQGQISASGLCVKMNGDNPTDGTGQPCPKLTSITVSSFRDINQDGQRNTTEPGSSMSMGTPGGPPSNEVCIGTFSASVGSGVGGPVITTITVTTSDGQKVAMYEKTSY